ncbi:MAG: hypothetical protein V3V08_21055 [Nannocystaceae bacterium]
MAEMFRPWLKVARPARWTGTLVRICVWAVVAVFLLWAVTGSLPQQWRNAVSEGFGGDLGLRAGMCLGVLWLGRSLAAVAYAMIPEAPVLFWRWLWLRLRGRRLQVAVADVRDVYLERRAARADEVFVVELADGVAYDICPVHWAGSERIFWALKHAASRTHLHGGHRSDETSHLPRAP